MLKKNVIKKNITLWGGIIRDNPTDRPKLFPPNNACNNGDNMTFNLFCLLITFAIPSMPE